MLRYLRALTGIGMVVLLAAHANGAVEYPSQAAALAALTAKEPGETSDVEELSDSDPIASSPSENQNVPVAGETGQL